MYGAAVWVYRMKLSTYAEVLLRAQRLMLLTIWRGYRTESEEALHVVTGVLIIEGNGTKIPLLDHEKLNEWGTRNKGHILI